MRVIVIGGGIVGASTAYHLTRRGVPTTLVDAGHLGQATAAGAGIVFPWPFPSDPAPLRAFCLAAAAHLPGLMADLAGEGHVTGYHAVGGISVGTDDVALDEEHASLTDLAGRPGYEGLGRVTRLPRGEPARRFPVLPEEYAGVSVEGMARIDGDRTAKALREAAEERGLRVVTGDAELTGDGTGVTGVRAGGEELPADRVVVAAGAWTAGLLRPFGVEVPVFPMRGQIVHVALPGHATSEWPALRVSGGDAYLLALPPNRVALSATREPDAGFDHRTTARGIHQVLSTALQIAPGLGEATLAHTRVGFRPASPDGQPLLGTVDGLPGVVVATGLGASGLTFGCYQGAVAARLATGEPAETDVAPFRPDRPAGT